MNIVAGPGLKNRGRQLTSPQQRNNRTSFMDPKQHQPQPEDFFSTRRQFLNRFGMGMGGLSLAWLLGEGRAGAVGTAVNPLSPKQPHFTGTAPA